MKIALLSPVEEPVPPQKYGGTELVVANLAEGLVNLGHEVHLLASGDSSTSAKLVPLFKQSIRQIAPDPKDSKLREAYKYITQGKVLEYLQGESFDIVHNHIGWRFLPFHHLAKAPVVTTLHGPLDTPYIQTVFKEYNHIGGYISISDSQRKPLPELNYLCTVYNGIHVERFSFQENPDDYFAFLGRMSPEKGPKQAIEAAKAAGVRLVMAAKVDAVDQAYFTQEIEPLIDGNQITFIGEVDHAGKVQLLRQARGLLALIQWDEPFGLFMVEALACGTPVIAIKRGSIPELIEDQKTGFIIDTQLESAVSAIQKISNLKRTDCRQSAEEKFSVEHMVKGYLAAYQKML